METSAAPSDSSSAAALGNPPRDIRLVALDLDGTAIRSDRTLSDATTDAVRQCVRNGVRVVLASARPPRSVRDIHEKLGLDTLSIHYNGALIHDLKTGRNVFHQPMPAERARRIADAARRTDPQCLVNVEILDRWYTDLHDDTAGLIHETARTFAPDFIGPIDAFLTVPATKLMLMAHPRRIGRLLSMIGRKFAGQVALTVSDDHLIQLMHPAVNKAAALQRVAADYGIEREHIMAVGDAPNDAEMLTWAGLGVAMSNAWPAAKDAADATVASNDDDGAAEALRRYVLYRVK